MKVVDRLCAGALFILGVLHCLLTPRSMTGRLWFFGTGLAMLFTAMLNWLRIRNGYGVRGLKTFCISGNLLLLALTLWLIASIGSSATLRNPQVPTLLVLIAVESVLSLRPNQ
jgi:hypothetical protein